MTTTAFDDQFTDAPEPVRQQYSTADILRRNVADLELALRTQTERAEAAEEKLTTAREDMQSWIDSRNGWMERAGAAEAELARLREQKPVRWHVRGNYFHDGDAAILFASMNAVHGAKVEQLFAAPVPVPAVPNEIGLGKGEFVIWPVKIGGVHGLAFVKTKDPKAVGTFHAEPEDGQIELGAGDSVIHFGNAESAAVLADRLQHVISLMNPANAAPVPVPHKGATHCDDCGLTWLDDGLNPLGCPYCKDTVPAPAVPSVMFLAHNKTSSILFAARKDADQYAASFGPAAGVSVTECAVIGSQSAEVTK